MDNSSPSSQFLSSFSQSFSFGGSLPTEVSSPLVKLNGMVAQRRLFHADRLKTIEIIFQENVKILQTKLDSKPEVLKNIDKLKTEIKKLEDVVANHRLSIANLEGGKKTRIPLIGFLIKCFYQIYHRSRLQEECNARDVHIAKKREHNQQIQELSKLFLSSKEIDKLKVESLFIGFICKIDKAIEENDFLKMIQLDQDLEVELEKEFPKEKYRDLRATYDSLYKTEILPFIEQQLKLYVSSLLSNESLDQMVQYFKEKKFDKIFEIEGQLRAALEKGFPEKAQYQTLYKKRVLPLLKQAKEAIRSRPAHLATEAAAAKGKALQASIRAMESLAENNPVIQSLGTSAQEVFLLSQNGVVFKHSNARAKEEEKIIDDLFQLKSKRAVVGAMNIRIPTLQNYGIQFSREVLARSFKPNDLSPYLRLQISQKLSEEHLKFLDKYEAKKQIYLSPDLSSIVNKADYEACEKFKWIFIDQNGIEQQVDFKTLHAYYLEKKIVIGKTIIKPLVNKGQKRPSSEALRRALKVPWKVISPEIMQTKVDEIIELHDIQAKSFIDDMILVCDLCPEERETALKSLTAADQVNAVLTTEFQLLDLHGENLGLAPEHTEEYARFKNLKFSIHDRELLNFKSLISEYLRGAIKPNTHIQFEENGKWIAGELKNLPELQKALNSKWKLVIFDTDLSLAEDNHLQFQIRAGKREHLIPLRSILLETEWKNQPLSDEAIQILMDSEEGDLRVKQWTNNEHATIYRRLSPETARVIRENLTPLIEHYDLSKPRFQQKDKEKITIQSLRKKFAKDMCELSSPQSLEIWQAMEQDLSSVLVRPNDTWETLANRHHQNVDTLKLLNPNGIHVGQKINIEYDLTSQSVDSISRRKQIAAQLFPPITSRQQKALLERQQRRKEYLNQYQEIANSNLTGLQLLDQIETYLKQPTTLFSLIRREELLVQLVTQKDQFLRDKNALSAFKKALCLEFQPTYFNIAKAMYPLLADAYALNLAMYQQNISKAGKAIGLYREPLEKTIRSAKMHFGENTPEWRLADHLEKQIATHKNPSFFGHWT